jgi:glucoamylase
MPNLWRGPLGAALSIASFAAWARAGGPSTIDMTEHIFGASNTNAIAGHGGLTVGVSAEGDVTVLSWPGPSFADQLAYLSSNDLAARSEPHFGASDGMGAYLGLEVTTAKGTSLVWLRDGSFAHTQAYTQPDAPVVATTFTHAGLGLTATLTDIVSPDADVLTRRLVITRAPGSPVSALSLVLYENLSPTLSEIPMLPFADWILDPRNDFAALYDRAAGAVIHVHPSDRAVMRSLGDFANSPTDVDYGPIDELMRTTPSDADVDALVSQLDTAFPPGVAAIITTEPAPAAFQVGSDATSLCGAVDHLANNIHALPVEFPGYVLPVDPSIADSAKCTDSLPSVRAARGWTWAPEDALANLARQALSGSRLAAGQTNAALVAPLSFGGDVAEGTAVFAFGASVADARAALAHATSIPAAARQAASESAAHQALGSASLPDPALGPLVTSIALRALVNLYVSRDRATGAVVASVSRQPPYFLDWPRDGSFITQALDLAGILPFASQRGEWYATVQRQEAAPENLLFDPDTPTDPDTGEPEFPAYAWEMNYFADGQPGGPIRFEIDNTALHVWAMVVHAATLGGADRDAFLGAVWPSLKSALHLLARWRDPWTHLDWPASEDDQFQLTSTLHGATAVYSALVAGARLAHFVGDEDAAQEALGRSLELHDAMVAAFLDPATGLFHDTTSGAPGGNAGSTDLGSTAWLAWPARLLAPDDPRLEAQLTNDMGLVLQDLRGETAGAAYDAKTVVAAALLGRDGGSRDMAREAVSRLAAMATPDTMQFGEVFVTTQPAQPDGGSAPAFSQRVATPHVWEGTLFYLAAMALSSAPFDAEIGEMPLPPPRPPELTPGGCAEGTEGVGGARRWPALLACGAFLGLVVALRRKAARRVCVSAAARRT